MKGVLTDMAEYIEREAAYEKCGWYNTVNGKSVCAVRKDELAAIPPAAVVPVRHGKWILRGNKILCSCCKAVFAEVDEKDLFEVHADLPYLCEIEKFCFNCGCKMDGENNGSE